MPRKLPDHGGTHPRHGQMADEAAPEIVKRAVLDPGTLHNPAKLASEVVPPRLPLLGVEHKFPSACETTQQLGHLRRKREDTVAQSSPECCVISHLQVSVSEMLRVGGKRAARSGGFPLRPFLYLHVQVTSGHPLLVRLDRKRAYQAQTRHRVREDPHHPRPPAEFLVEPL